MKKYHFTDNSRFIQCGSCQTQFPYKFQKDSVDQNSYNVRCINCKENIPVLTDKNIQELRCISCQKDFSFSFPIEYSLEQTEMIDCPFCNNEYQITMGDIHSNQNNIKPFLLDNDDTIVEEKKFSSEGEIKSEPVEITDNDGETDGRLIMDINDVLEKLNSVDESFLIKWQEFITKWDLDSLREWTIQQDLEEEEEFSVKLSYKEVQKELGASSEVEKVACIGLVASWVAVNRSNHSKGNIPYLVKTDVPQELVDRAYSDLQHDSNKSGCFIATASFGNYNSPEVRFFRLWRDDYLMKSKSGRLFISLYYLMSPILAKQISRSNTLKRSFRTMLNYLIERLGG